MLSLAFKESFASHVSRVVPELNLFLQGSEDWALRSFGILYFIFGVVLKTLNLARKLTQSSMISILVVPAGDFAALEAPGVGAVVHSNYEFIINKLAVLSCLRKGYFAE